MYPPPGHMNSGKAFVWMDRRLDAAQDGPTYLRQERIANAVVDSLHRGVELGHYQLRAWVLMANHVHALLFPLVSPPRLLRALKGSTARAANRILGRTGETFWQAESYDHWARDEREMERIAAYIENNPVQAGLAARPEDYAWSSARARGPGAERSLGAADTSVCATTEGGV